MVAFYCKQYDGYADYVAGLCEVDLGVVQELESVQENLDLVVGLQGALQEWESTQEDLVGPQGALRGQESIQEDLDHAEVRQGDSLEDLVKTGPVQVNGNVLGLASLNQVHRATNDIDTPT